MNQWIRFNRIIFDISKFNDLITFQIFFNSTGMIQLIYSWIFFFYSYEFALVMVQYMKKNEESNIDYKHEVIHTKLILEYWNL